MFGIQVAGSCLTCILWSLVVSPAPVRSISTVDLSEKSSVVIPPPDYLECLSRGAAADKKGDVPKNTSTFKAPVSKAETTSSVSRAAAWCPV